MATSVTRSCEWKGISANQKVTCLLELSTSTGFCSVSVVDNDSGSIESIKEAKQYINYIQACYGKRQMQTTIKAHMCTIQKLKNYATTIHV